eukprot:1043622-Lingulodinium_polyedra.AAC.1
MHSTRSRSGGPNAASRAHAWTAYSMSSSSSSLEPDQPPPCGADSRRGWAGLRPQSRASPTSGWKSMWTTPYTLSWAPG